MIWSGGIPRASPSRFAASLGLEIRLGSLRRRKTFWVQPDALIAEEHGRGARNAASI